MILNSTIVHLRSIPKYFFGQIWSRNFRILCLKWNSVPWGYSRVLLLNSTIFHLNPVPKLFLVKFGPKTSKCFVLNEARYIGIFKGVDSEFDDSFLRFCPQNNFLGQIWSQNFKVLCFKWSYSWLLIVNLTVVLLNSFPKIPFLGKFGPETQKSFVLAKTWKIGIFKGTDSSPKYLTWWNLVSKLKSVLFKRSDSEFDNSFLNFRP